MGSNQDNGIGANRVDAEDVEGHKVSPGRLVEEEPDDVEGHSRNVKATDDDEDTEGHMRRSI